MQDKPRPIHVSAAVGDFSSLCAMALPTILPEQLCDAKALPNLTCPVCQEIFSEPKCSPCGHFLCEGCWLRQLHAPRPKRTLA